MTSLPKRNFNEVTSGVVGVLFDGGDFERLFLPPLKLVNIQLLHQPKTSSTELIFQLRKEKRAVCRDKSRQLPPYAFSKEQQRHPEVTSRAQSEYADNA